LVDIDCNSFNLDVHALADKITSRTKAIIPVHLFGLCADMDAIAQVADSIPLIEDAACAAGSAYKNRSAGSLGLAAAFSFHPRKSITTGEGGMVTTQDKKLFETINQLRNHGATVSEEQRHHGSQPYLLPEFHLLGFNYRMTDLQGALGLCQLQKLDHFLQERQQWAAFYTEQLRDVHWLKTPMVPDSYTHGWQSFVCYVDESSIALTRNQIMAHLQSQGVSTRPGTHAVHELSLYRQKFGFTADDFPVARDCARYSMALPLHNNMTEADYAYVVHCLQDLH
jgi:dTDP-4-amino-4,6-dideoxygalactose transaminase